MAILTGSHESIEMSDTQLVASQSNRDNAPGQTPLSHDQLNIEAIIPRVDLRIMPFLVLSMFLTPFKAYHPLGLNQTAIFGSRVAAIIPVVFLAGVSAVKSLGATLVLWGIMTVCSATVSSHAAIFACEILAAMLETAILPSLVGVLGQWYGTSRHSTRISFCWCGMIAGQSLGNLLAKCIDYKNDWWMVVLSFGVATATTGVLITIFVPDSPQTATWTLFKEAERKTAMSQEVASAWTIPQGFLSTKTVQIFLDVQIWSFVLLVCVLSVTSTLPNLDSFVGWSNARLLITQTSLVLMAAVLIVGHGVSSTGNAWAWIAALSCIGLLGSAVAISNPEHEWNVAKFLVVKYLLYIGNAALPGLIIWVSTKVSCRIKRAFIFAVMAALFHLQDILLLKLVEEKKAFVPEASGPISLAGFATATVLSVCRWAIWERRG